MQLKEATIVFLIRDNQILLAMKKRGFGEGKWNGAGGKKLPDETIEQAAIREAQEEIGVTPKNLEQRAIIEFHYPEKQDEVVHKVWVFFTNSWVGEPAESEEMRPQWFDLDKIPYQEMWEDDPHWLPKVLEGKNITGKFMFDQNKKMTDFEVSEN